MSDDKDDQWWKNELNCRQKFTSQKEEKLKREKTKRKRMIVKFTAEMANLDTNDDDSVQDLLRKFAKRVILNDSEWFPRTNFEFDSDSDDADWIDCTRCGMINGKCDCVDEARREQLRSDKLTKKVNKRLVEKYANSTPAPAPAPDVVGDAFVYAFGEWAKEMQPKNFLPEE